MLAQRFRSELQYCTIRQPYLNLQCIAARCELHEQQVRNIFHNCKLYNKSEDVEDNEEEVRLQDNQVVVDAIRKEDHEAVVVQM